MVPLDSHEPESCNKWTHGLDTSDHRSKWIRCKHYFKDKLEVAGIPRVHHWDAKLRNDMAALPATDVTARYSATMSSSTAGYSATTKF